MSDTPIVPPSGTPTEAPPTRHDTPDRVHAPSVVIVNTGDGKGKSTAAFGTALRAVARGWPVAVVQFLKSGTWRAGEEQVCRSLGIDWWTIGDGFTWESGDLEESEAVAREAWRAARNLLSAGEHRLVVLDEVTYACNWGWIDSDEVATAIRDRPEDVNVVLTGRDAPAWMIDLADTVSEVRKVKHAYDRGVLARRGIDY